jgi:hypothetical protein
VAVNADPQDEAIEVVEQEKFYGDKYFALFLFVGLLALLSAGLLQLIFLLRSTAAPPPTFFSVTESGALLEEAPLDKPNIDENVLLNWVAEAMMTVNTYNFVNYASAIEAAEAYFSKEGYATYKQFIERSGIVRNLVEKKLVLKATPLDSPHVVLGKVFAGRYMWKVKIPMRFRYQSVRFENYGEFEITLIVMRVPTRESSNGILILKYLLEPRASE